MKGTLGEKGKVPFKRATNRVKKGPLFGVSLMLPRKRGTCTV